MKRPGVEPVFLDQEQAIDYAKNRACFRSGEIRILDSAGNIERSMPFTEADRLGITKIERTKLAGVTSGQD